MTKLILDWEKYRNTAITAAEEGAVLIKNDDNVLPLNKGTRIALFGRMQSHYYKSGTGSGGMVNVDHVVNIREGLLMEDDLKLDDELMSVYDKWEKTHPIDSGLGWGMEKWSQLEMTLDEDLVKETASRNDVAIIIIARTAGEDRDNYVGEGSYLLSSIEEDMISKVTSNFDRSIILLNVGNIIDMSFVNKYNPSSVLYVWQGGMIGGISVANIISGRATPSGALTDTIAYSIDDYASSANFGNKDEYEDIYEEDIYVGYRYFSTFAPDKVMYPFGWGLSYTSFIAELVEATLDDELIRASIKVRNIGNYAGKKIIFLTVCPPKGLISKSSIVLVGFNKTKTLAPGEETIIDITCTKEQYASYDDDNRLGLGTGWVLEKGMYVFGVADNIRDSLFTIGSIMLEESVLVEGLESALRPVVPFRRMTGDGSYEDVPIRERELVLGWEECCPQEIKQTGDRGIKLLDVRNKKNTMDEFIAQLSDEDLSLIIRGEGMSSPKVTTGTAAAFGGVSAELKSYGIPTLCCDDGPSGMRIDSGKKAFSLPNGTCLASTFNEELNEELFSFFGTEMISNKVDTILGPGINIHRHPLNGRNFEYFSEDPLVTGLIASAQLRGLRSRGVNGTIKHFCANNREKLRREANSVVSEKALREIYLRGFEIAIKKGGAKSVMSVYNKINGTYGTALYDLHTTILRKQWGFKGIVMTDWWAYILTKPMKKHDHVHRELSLMARAQCDIYMVCSEVERNNLYDVDVMRNLEDKRTECISRAELQRNARNILEYALDSIEMSEIAGDKYEVTHVDFPFSDEGVNHNCDIYYELGKEGLEIDASSIKRIGNDYIFGISCSHIGIYKIRLTGSSNLGELAQVPMTYYMANVPYAVITWNGTSGEDVIKEDEIMLLSQYQATNIHFAGPGVELKKICIEYVRDFNSEGK